MFFLSFPLFVFFIYSITFLWFLFLQAVSECTLLWVEKGEKKAIFFSPSGYCFDFPKLLGGSSCLPAEGSAVGVTSFSPCISAGSSASIWGRQCLCLLPLSRRSVQLWSKWELIRGLLMPPCFVFSPLWSRLGSVDGALSFQCLKVGSNPGAPDTRSPTGMVRWWGERGSRLISWGACKCVLTCQELARCSGLICFPVEIMWIDRGLWLGWLQVGVAVGVLWVAVRMLIYLTRIFAVSLVNPIAEGQDPVLIMYS